MNVAREIRIDESTVIAIAEGSLNRMEGMGEEAAKAGVVGLIRQIAPTYGATNPVSVETLKECAFLVWRKYRHMGLGEIRMAYRLWVADELDVKGGESFHGNFTVVGMGKVLAGYDKYRQRIRNEYREEEAREEQRQEAAKAEAMRAEYDRMFPGLVAEGRERYKSWVDAPEHWFDTAIRLEMMPCEHDQELIEQARQYAFVEAENEAENETNRFKRKALFESAIERAEPKEKRIYKKLFVWKYLLNPEPQK